MVKDGDRKIINITHKIELLIWLIIILIGVMIFSLYFIANKDTNKESDYQIFINDVDGLIVGSPVRMMGIEVGHVTQIKPLKNEVFVNFRITNPEVYIPQGTQITVEFTGMAGSKSLELYPPDKTTYIDKNTSLLEVLPPKRLNDSLGLVSVMYKKLMSIIYTSSKFGKEVHKTVGNDFNKTADMNQILDYTNKTLEDTDEKIYTVIKKLDKKERGNK